MTAHVEGAAPPPLTLEARGAVARVLLVAFNVAANILKGVNWQSQEGDRLSPLPRLPHSQGPGAFLGVHLEQARKLFCHRPGQLFDIGDRHGALVIARHVMADANGDQLYRAALFNRSHRADVFPGTRPR